MNESNEAPLSDVEEKNQSDLERAMIEDFVAKKEALEVAKANLAETQKAFEDINDRLLKLLEDEDKTASARYEGLGHVTKIEGAAYASIEMGRSGDVLKYLEEIGRGDMIKTKVEPATLSAFVRECLKQNAPLPPGVTFYKPKWINFYSAKK